MMNDPVFSRYPSWIHHESEAWCGAEEINAPCFSFFTLRLIWVYWSERRRIAAIVLPCTKPEDANQGRVECTLFLAISVTFILISWCKIHWKTSKDKTEYSKPTFQRFEDDLRLWLQRMSFPSSDSGTALDSEKCTKDACHFCACVFVKCCELPVVVSCLCQVSWRLTKQAAAVFGELLKQSLWIWKPRTPAVCFMFPWIPVSCSTGVTKHK